jgi:hypothetical protein
VVGELVFLGLLIAGLVASNVWWVKKSYRHLRLSLPASADELGTRPVSGRLQARIEGRPMPGPTPCWSPLSERPCAAWRLSVLKRGPLGLIVHTYERYSEASFSIVCEGERVPVILHPDSTSSLWDSNPFLPPYVPVWTLPPANLERGFTMRFYGGVPSPALDPSLSKDESLALQRAATKALARFEVPARLLHDEILLTESIIDFQRKWVCEGPAFDKEGKLFIESTTKGNDGYWDPRPVKFAPLADLPALTRKTLAIRLIPLLILDVLLLVPVAHGFIRILIEEISRP